MLAKHLITLRRTKFTPNQGADLHLAGALAFEVPLHPFPPGEDGVAGIRDFTNCEARSRRRERSKHFWQD